MANKTKTSVQEILRPSHLEAIGLVAAQWNSFELMTLHVLSKVTNNSFHNLLILINHAPINKWLEMLSSLIGDKDEELKKIIKTADELRIHRNNIVHSVWDDSRFKKGLLSDLETEPPDLAVGFGLSKSKKKLILKTQYTSNEMIAIAKQIDDLETSIISWLRERTKRLMLIDALNNQLGIPKE